MKLQLNQPFTLEITESGKDAEVIQGTLSDTTKKQNLEFITFLAPHKKISDKLQRLSNKLALIEDKISTPKWYQLSFIYRILFYFLERKVIKMVTAINSMDIEEQAAKKRFDLCVDSDSIERITELCDLVGYAKVMKTILEDIEEKKGNATPA